MLQREHSLVTCLGASRMTNLSRCRRSPHLDTGAPVELVVVKGMAGEIPDEILGSFPT